MAFYVAGSSLRGAAVFELLGIWRLFGRVGVGMPSPVLPEGGPACTWWGGLRGASLRGLVWAESVRLAASG